MVHSTVWVIVTFIQSQGPWYKITTAPDWRFKTPLSTTEPEEKKGRSRTFAQGYTLSNLLKFEDHIDVIVLRLLKWMDKYAKEGKPMELGKYFFYTAFDVIGEVMFSDNFGFIQEGREIDNALAVTRPANASAAVAGYYPWLHLMFLNPFVTWLGILPLGHLFNTAMKAVKERESNPDARFDMLVHWFKFLKEHPDRMTLRDIHAMVTINVGAGSDSISGGLPTFVYHLIRNPPAWQRVRDEIDAARKRGKCLDPIVSYADSKELEYLQACIKESLRLFGPAGTGLPPLRVALPGGLTIEDQFFPAGTVLSLHPYTMQIDKACWGADAEEFKPVRWMTSDITSKEPFWLVFGLGYTICPGHHLAKVELSKITATLVRDYDIRQQDPDEEWEFEAYFNTLPHGWPCYITKVVPGVTQGAIQ
ncbi:cytochrome P450 [Xylariales sp. PMI_506]|nr:cytochrome P450 [Xylariales sp. PMI_506]